MVPGSWHQSPAGSLSINEDGRREHCVLARPAAPASPQGDAGGQSPPALTPSSASLPRHDDPQTSHGGLSPQGQEGLVSLPLGDVCPASHVGMTMWDSPDSDDDNPTFGAHVPRQGHARSPKRPDSRFRKCGCLAHPDVKSCTRGPRGAAGGGGLTCLSVTRPVLRAGNRGRGSTRAGSPAPAGIEHFGDTSVLLQRPRDICKTRNVVQNAHNQLRK